MMVPNGFLNMGLTRGVLLAATAFCMVLPALVAAAPQSASLTLPQARYGAALAPAEQFGGPILAVAGKNDTAYVGLGPRVAVMSLAEPTHPRMLGLSPVLPGVVWDLVTVGHYGYALVTDQTLDSIEMLETTRRQIQTSVQVLDLANPEDIRVIAAYYPPPAAFLDDKPVTPGPVYALALTPPYLYLGTSGGLLILDIHVPSVLRHVSFLPIPADPVNDLAVESGLAYLATESTILRVVDVRKPEAPVEIGGSPVAFLPQWLPSGGGFGGGANSIVARNRQLFVSVRSGGIFFMSLTEPRSPRFEGFFQGVGQVALAVNPPFLVAASEQGLLSVFDPRKEDDPLVGDLGLGTELGQIAMVGRWLVVAGGALGLRVVDLVDPTAPNEVGAFVATASPTDLAIVGDIAYVTDSLTGLQILDLSNPEQPRKIGGYGAPDAQAVTVVGDLAYVLTGRGAPSLRIVSVATPSRPRELGGLAMLQTPTDVLVRGSFAYVATEAEAEDSPFVILLVVDVSDPTAPVRVGQLEAPQAILFGALAWNGARLLIGTSDELRLVDVSQPDHPRILSSYFPPIIGRTFPAGLAVEGDTAYLAAGTGGLHIVDLSEPQNLASFAELNLVRTVNDVAVADQRAFVSTLPLRLQNMDVAIGPPNVEVQVYDVAEPTAPRLLGRRAMPTFGQRTSGEAAHLAWSGGRLYVAEPSTGLHALDLIEGPQVFLPQVMR